MKFYFVGQVSMANRGCEALIRSNAQLIREKYPDARIFCPSEAVALDLKQWPDAAEKGIDFTNVPTFPNALKAWGKIITVLPAIRRMGPVPVALDESTKDAFNESDSVLMTGGDIISLEYGLNSLYYWAGIMDAAHRMGRKTHLLAASVGPFSKDPVLERQMVKHLRRYTTITVRETASLAYLHKLGVDADLVADPAFVMLPEPVDTSPFMEPNREYLGINVSPLVRKFRADDASRAAFDRGIIEFIRQVVADTDFNVLLIPHVDPLAGSSANSDRAYMSALLTQLPELADRVKITPDLLNAAQIKSVLAKCRFFIGARTHATIGALSQGVPTISIAYSIKAVGINQDLFNTTRYVLPTPDVSPKTLMKSLACLQESETEITAILAERIPQWKEKARLGLDNL